MKFQISDFRFQIHKPSNLQSAICNLQSPRILIVRTDRMGDVILSTPVIRALREALPKAYLGMMVDRANRELVEGHPDLDVVILYDKQGRQRGWWSTLQFAKVLRSHRFDTALILHSTNRIVLVSFLAGIHRRIGYARRLSWLLTDRLPYVKREGNRHELDYNLDLLRLLGIQPLNRTLAIPTTPSNSEKVDVFFRQQGINPQRPIVVLHPGASCPSKRWPAERFARVADQVIERYGWQVVVVTGPQETAFGEGVTVQMRQPAFQAFGVFSLGELACFLKRSKCLVSNDSGPVHLACAVGTPVVSIFGRWERGLSPTRWGPTGPNSISLHHDVGCRPCLAHRCSIGFVCLKAVTIEEVLAAIEQVAGLHPVDKDET